MMQSIFVLIHRGSTSRGHFSSNIVKQYFKATAQRDRGHFRFHVSVIEMILSSINFWPPIQPNLDEFVTHLELCVDCYTVRQVNQDRRLPVKPAQSTECCSENALKNAMAFPMDGQKSSRKGPKPNVRQKMTS